MQTILLLSAAIATTIANAADSAKETYTEDLKVWPLPNDFNLLNYEFEFVLPKTKQSGQSPFYVNYFPL